MNTENRRGFLKTLLTGGAAAVVPGAKAQPAPTEPPPPKVVTVTKTVIERVVAPFPENINGEEMAMWLEIKERRRNQKPPLNQRMIDEYLEVQRRKVLGLKPRPE